MSARRILLTLSGAVCFAIPAYCVDRPGAGRFSPQRRNITINEDANEVRRFRNNDPPSRVAQTRRGPTRGQTRTQATGATRSGNPKTLRRTPSSPHRTATPSKGILKPTKVNRPANVSRLPQRMGTRRLPTSGSRPSASGLANRKPGTRAQRPVGPKPISSRPGPGFSSRPGGPGISSRPGGGRPAAKKSKFPYKGLGGATGALAIGGAASGMMSQQKQDKEHLRTGKITQAQYQQRQEKRLIDGAATLASIKKLNPSGMVMNDMIGTDPISLGADVVGDLLHGTNNTKKTFQNMGDAFDRSLVKQTVTDPKGAAKRVGKGIKKTGDKVGKGIKKTGEKIGEGFKKVGGLFKKK